MVFKKTITTDMTNYVQKNDENYLNLQNNITITGFIPTYVSVLTLEISQGICYDSTNTVIMTAPLQTKTLSLFDEISNDGLLVSAIITNTMYYFYLCKFSNNSYHILGLNNANAGLSSFLPNNVIRFKLIFTYFVNNSGGGQFEECINNSLGNSINYVYKNQLAFNYNYPTSNTPTTLTYINTHGSANSIVKIIIASRSTQVGTNQSVLSIIGYGNTSTNEACTMYGSNTTPLSNVYDIFSTNGQIGIRATNSNFSYNNCRTLGYLQLR
jgi:hypothetical protein